MRVEGNGGSMNNTEKANVKGCGEVGFYEWVITSILALSNFKRKSIVTDDSNNDRVLTVYNPNRQDVYFNMHKYRPH